MRPILAGMDATHGNAPCHLYFTLAPLMIACEAEAAGQGNDAGKCPNGTLYECKSLMVGVRRAGEKKAFDSEACTPGGHCHRPGAYAEWHPVPDRSERAH